MAIIFTYTLYLKNLTIQNNVKYPGKQKEGVWKKVGGYSHSKNPGVKMDLIRALGGAHSREHFSSKMICSRNDKTHHVQ